MEGSASRKVPDGKLVEVSVSYGEEFRDVAIRGDFFLEPPTVEPLEAAVEGLPVDSDRDRIVDAIRSVDVQLIGFDAEDLAVTLQEATNR